MAKDRQTEQVAESIAPLEAHVVTPAQRQRLQKCYTHALKLSTQETKPDYDYAHTLLTECVTQDPGNLLYVEALLDNLERKFDRNKKGARLAGLGGARGGVKKAASKGEWTDVLALGPDALSSNPWDVATLRALARACQAHHYNEVELRYLKNALDANPKDVEVNRHCAESLARMGQFDQSIACWKRVEEFGKGKDKDEALSKVSELTVERARGRSGLPGEAHPLPASSAKTALKGQDLGPESSPKTRTTREASAGTRKKPVEQEGAIIDSPEVAAAFAKSDPTNDEFRRSLEKAIADHPGDAGSYVLLADLFAERGDFDEAQQLLDRGLAASGRSLAIIERLEDLLIERAQHQVAVAEKRQVNEKSEEAQHLVQTLRRELNRIELSVLSHRVERYPEEHELKFELAVRLKRAGNFEEAAQNFLAARERGPNRAAAALELGETLQHLKRFHDALSSYEVAIELAGEDDLECRKKALYRSGILATGMRKLDKAETLLRDLESLDPNYKDLPARLDKIRKIRDSV